MARTMASDPLQGFRFKVEIDGFSEQFGFRKVDGLESDIEVVKYREGGNPTTMKLPGIEETGTLSLERGVFKNMDMYNWFRQVLEDPDFRKTVTVIEQDRLGNEVRRWTLEEAWASKFTAPNKDADSSEVSVDRIEIQYEELAGETK